MLLPSCMSFVAPLRGPPQHFCYDLARGSTQLRVSNLLASDQTLVKSLPQRLTDEAAFDRSGLDHIKNGPQGARELEALRCLHIALGQVSVM